MPLTILAINEARKHALAGIAIYLLVLFTGAKHVLGPRCMIPYVKLYTCIWYHTPRTINVLGPCGFIGLFKL